MLEFLEYHMPYIYYRLWLLDYLYVIPAAMCFITCPLGMLVASFEKDLKKADEPSLLEFMSVTCCALTLICGLLRFILIAVTGNY